jgi:hypothetical protein
LKEKIKRICRFVDEIPHSNEKMVFFFKWGGPSLGIEKMHTSFFIKIKQQDVKNSTSQYLSHHLAPRNPAMGEVNYRQGLYPKKQKQRSTS